MFGNTTYQALWITMLVFVTGFSPAEKNEIRYASGAANSANFSIFGTDDRFQITNTHSYPLKLV